MAIKLTRNDLSLIKPSRWGGLTDEAKREVVDLLVSTATGRNQSTPTEQLKASNMLIKIDRVNMLQEQFEATQIEVEVDKMSDAQLMAEFDRLTSGTLQISDS